MIDDLHTAKYEKVVLCGVTNSGTKIAVEIDLEHDLQTYVSILRDNESVSCITSRGPVSYNFTDRLQFSINGYAQKIKYIVEKPEINYVVDDKLLRVLASEQSC